MATLALLTGCVSASTGAICDGTAQARDRLNVALLQDGGPESQREGARLIGLIDAGCAD